MASPLYFIVVASRDRKSADALPPAVSVFADGDDWAYNDWYKVMRESWAKDKRIKELEGMPGLLRRIWRRLVK